ncbi:MAG: type II CRISPR-associated endonuclease Cas1 [Planctomycetota bacterium]|nr:type II CRISPR-associated endonuclease Cas1 [Planctomycetota bacterium]
MPDHILDLSRDPCWLGVEGALLVIRRDAKPEFKLRLDEIAAVCVSQPASTASFRALGALAAAGAIVVVCDEKHAPSGMLMPLANHHAQTPRFLAQAAMGVVQRKRLWRQVVKAKVRQQAAVLDASGGDGTALRGMMARVMSGDRTNVEAQAAVSYWPALFGEAFRRDREEEGVNALLNYGYAVLRSAMTRAICATGLHPTLGLMHHHRENPFCLADDLIEPYRPIIDRAVFSHVHRRGEVALLPEIKVALVEAITRRVRTADSERSLFDSCARTARSLVAVVMGRRKSLSLPEWIPDA